MAILVCSRRQHRAQVGRDLSRNRKERNWSQEAPAVGSGLHRASIGGIERGTSNPTVVILARLAEWRQLSAA